MEQLWYSFSDAIPVFTVIIPFVLWISWVSFKKQTKTGRSRPEALFLSSTGALFTLSIIGIVLITLLPNKEALTAQTLQLKPFSSITHLIEYSITSNVTVRLLGFNIILFIPFGFFFALRFYKQVNIWIITIIGMLFSTGIETAQYVLAIGRTSNIDDVILNTSGTFIGAIFGAFLGYLLQRKARR